MRRFWMIIGFIGVAVMIGYAIYVLSNSGIYVGSLDPRERGGRAAVRLYILWGVAALLALALVGALATATVKLFRKAVHRGRPDDQ